MTAAIIAACVIVGYALGAFVIVWEESHGTTGLWDGW